MSRRLLHRGSSRQSRAELLVRPATRAHLLRPLSRNEMLCGHAHMPPKTHERLDTTKCSQLMICTLKDFNRSRNDLASAKQEDHSTKEETQIMKAHFRPARKLSDHPSKQAYRRFFIRAQQDQQRWFLELCQSMGILL